jgi:hypothetical protein
MPEPGTLHHAFLEDHRRLTRGLAAVLETLRRGDLTGATRAAEVLDEAAGPHVAFQEDRWVGCGWNVCTRISGPGSMPSRS